MNSMYDYLMHRETGIRKQAADKKSLTATYNPLQRLFAKLIDNPTRPLQEEVLQNNLKRAQLSKQLTGLITDRAMMGRLKTPADAAREALGMKPFSYAKVKQIVPVSEKGHSEETAAKGKSLLDQFVDGVNKNKGALIGASSSIPAALIAAGVSKENKLRNAALTGLAVGILGTGAGMAYDKFMA